MSCLCMGCDLPVFIFAIRARPVQRRALGYYILDLVRSGYLIDYLLYWTYHFLDKMIFLVPT
jgi:EamA domain-containing membrane protein RarD